MIIFIVMKSALYPFPCDIPSQETRYTIVYIYSAVIYEYNDKIPRMTKVFYLNFDF